MPRRRRAATPATLSTDILKAAVHSAEMMSAAAITIGLRTTAMGAAWGDWRKADPVEMTRMVTEKMDAAGESAAAGTRSMLDVQREVARLWTGGNPMDVQRNAMRLWMDGFNAWSRMAALGVTGYAGMLTPYHTRTTANARRLGRKRP